MTSSPTPPARPARSSSAERDELVRYRLLLQSLEDAVARCQIVPGGEGGPLDYRILEVNAAFATLLGLPAAELVGRALCDLASPDGRGWAELCGRDWQPGDVVQLELPERAGGWLEARAAYLGGDQIAFLLRDVSAQRQAEAALRACSSQQNELLESMPDGFFILDAQHIVTYFNRAAEQLLGRRRDEVLGRPIFETFPELIGTIFEDKYWEALRARRLIAFDARFDVAPYANWYDVRLFPRDGEIAVYFQVITERKRAEEALHYSEERLRVSQELSLDAFTLLESVRDDEGEVVDFRWTFANPAAGSILKHPPEDLIGQRLLDVLPGNATNSELFRRYVRVVQTGEPHDIEIPYQSEGIDGWFRNMCVRLGDGVAVSFSDITPRKRTEIQLRQLEEISAALSAALTPAEVTDVIIRRGLEAVGAMAGSVLLLVEGDAELEMVHSVGYAPSTVQNWRRFPVDAATSPLGRAVQTHAPVFLQNVAEFEQEFPALLPQRELAFGAWVALPLEVDDRVFGGIGLSFPQPRRFDADDRRFMLALAHHCAQALERARLTERARESATILERQRLARDLHDAVSQVLFASTTVAEAIQRQAQREPDKAFERLEQVVLLNRAAMAEMRSLLFELRPEVIDKTPLPVLLGQLIDAARGRRHIEVELICPRREITLPPPVHNAFYRIAQEAINNVLKHSHAEKLSVRFAQEEPWAELALADDGRGFEMGQSRGGLGLGNMRERAEGVGAALEIESAPGAGTRVTLRWRAPAAASA